MAGTEAFREKIRRLGELVAGLDALPGDKNAAARELSSFFWTFTAPRFSE